EGLGLRAGDDMFLIFRDHITGMEYIRSNDELIERGLYAELGAYKCYVFLDFREVRDDLMHHYAQLAGFLDGRGVPSIDEALKELFLQPIHYPFKELVNADMFGRLRAAVATDEGRRTKDEGRTLADAEDELIELAALEDAPDTDLQDDATLSGATPDTRHPTPDTQPLLDEVEQKMLRLLHEIKLFTESGGD